MLSSRSFLYADVDFQGRGYLGRDPGDRNLARDRNVAPAFDRRMVVDLGDRKALRQGRSCERPIGAGDPETDAALVGTRDGHAAHKGERKNKRTRQPAMRRMHCPQTRHGTPPNARPDALSRFDPTSPAQCIKSQSLRHLAKFHRCHLPGTQCVFRRAASHCSPGNAPACRLPGT